jgi:AcrR family transcriptional regulator
MKENVKNQPGRPRSVQSHEAILKATLELLAELGYQIMTIDGVAARAGVGKTTIYRRYSCKEELVADAIESLREEIVIPDTGSVWGDINTIVEGATKTSLTPLGRQILALIIGAASNSPKFAQVYWEKYLKPRRQAFCTVIERAKERKEIRPDTDSDLVFDLISGVMLYTLVFQPSHEPLEIYIRRAIATFLR